MEMEEPGRKVAKRSSRGRDSKAKGENKVKLEAAHTG
jgi:hypothetical protein